jgi:hypothetical protein
METVSLISDTLPYISQITRRSQCSIVGSMSNIMDEEAALQAQLDNVDGT